MFQDAWIGLSDTKHDGDWLWTDETPLSWNNGIWLRDHPKYNGRKHADDTALWDPSNVVPDDLAIFTKFVDDAASLFPIQS